MSREAFSIDLNPEQIDSRTFGVIANSIRSLAHHQARPYIRQVVSEASDFTDNDFVYPTNNAEMPADEQIGVYSESGTLEEGIMKFIWYEPHENGLIEPDDEEGLLRGQLDFAKQEGDTYFFGTVKAYHEGITATAIGFESSSDDDRNNRFMLFAATLGLDSMWRRIDERVGSPEETVFDGLPNRLLALRISQALKLQASQEQ